MASLPSHAAALCLGLSPEKAVYQMNRACNPPFDLKNITPWLAETESMRNWMRNQAIRHLEPFDIPKREEYFI